MKAFKLGFILLCVGAAVSGCAARETHRIRVVPRFVPEVISGGPAELGASTAAVAPTVSPTFSAKGVWLYRLVETPTQGGGIDFGWVTLGLGVQPGGQVDDGFANILMGGF